MNYFVKNLRNEIALAGTGKLMRFYMSGIRDVVLLIFVSNCSKLKKEVVTVKEKPQDSSLNRLSASDGLLQSWSYYFETF